MKSILIGGLLLSSTAVFAQSCPVDVPNEIHINNGEVSVYQSGQPKVMIDEDNNVFINGKQLDLSAMQRRALEAYSNGVKEYLPKMADIASDGVSIATDVLDEVSSSFDSKESFANVEALIDEYGQKAQDKFYKDDEFVMPADMFSDVDESWKTEFDEAMKHVSVESMSSLFAALSDEMKDGEINFTELQTKFSDLKQRIEERVKARSGEMAVKADDLCSSIKGLAQEEQELHKAIPELKDYQMFEI